MRQAREPRRNKLRMGLLQMGGVGRRADQVPYEAGDLLVVQLQAPSSSGENVEAGDV